MTITRSQLILYEKTPPDKRGRPSKKKKFTASLSLVPAVPTTGVAPRRSHRPRFVLISPTLQMFLAARCMALYALAGDPSFQHSPQPRAFRRSVTVALYFPRVGQLHVLTPALRDRHLLKSLKKGQVLQFLLLALHDQYPFLVYSLRLNKPQAQGQQRPPDWQCLASQV